MLSGAQRTPTQASTPARSRPSFDGRGHRIGPSLRTRAFVAMARSGGLRSAERRPRHSSCHVVGKKVSIKVRRNRRAAGASAGGKRGCDERSRSEQTRFLPAVGDRQIADLFRRRSSALPQNVASDSLRSLRLCGEKPDRWVVSASPRSQLRRTASKKPSAAICVICGFSWGG